MLFDTISYVTGADFIYDISGSTLSAPSDTDVVMRFESPRAFTIPANFAGTVLRADTAPTGTAAVFQLKVAGSNVSGATLTVNAGANDLSAAGTFSAQSVAAGDLVELVVTTASSIDAVAWTIRTVSA